MNDSIRSRFTDAQIIQIDPAQCRPHPANRRDLAHAAPHIDKLKASILEAGQLVPAIVLAVDDQMYTVFGACRTEATRQLRAEGHNIFLSAIKVEGVLSLGALMIAAEQTSTRASASSRSARRCARPVRRSRRTAPRRSRSRAA